MRLYFIRHGETTWNAESRLQGHADISLSATGVGQVKSLQPLISQLGSMYTISSDLKRVRETAELINVNVDEYDPNLREIDVGDWTGVNFSDLKSDYPEKWNGWRAGTWTPNKAEPWEQFTDRVIGSLKSHILKTDGDILVLCHGGVIRASLCYFLNLSAQQVISPAQASLNVINFDKTTMKAKLELFNYRPEMPSLINAH